MYATGWLVWQTEARVALDKKLLTSDAVLFKGQYLPGT